MIDKIKVILLDIEGSTTPIDFVHKILFPYSRERMLEFVRVNFDTLDEEVRQLKTEHSTDASYGSAFDESSVESTARYLRFLIDNDRKSQPLKSIQGKIWKAGYDSGEIRSRVFDDVPPALERWTAAGKQIAIYSSGSIQAQRDLFEHSDHGDLTRFITAYFDTTAGGKKDVESYAKIANELAVEPQQALFISDVIAELDAADATKMQTVLSVREGNAPTPARHKYQIIRSFDELG